MSKQYKSDFSKVLSTIEKLNEGGSNRPDDSMFWKPEMDKAGNAFATIRFLPEREGSLPFVRLFSHGFQGPTNKWFIENCPTTLGHSCPVCESNRSLWDDNNEQAKNIVRQRKRRLHYIANILVLDDPKHPENNGKVFLYKFGKKIYEMIVDKIKPQFEDEEPYNPFCPYTGADFKLKMRKVEGYPNYDKSEFSRPGPLFGGDDDAIAEILSTMHTLEEQIAPTLFKTEKELQDRFDKAIGKAAIKPASVIEDSDDLPFEIDDKPVKPETVKPKARPLPKMDLEDDSEDSDYFAKLAAL